METKKTFKLYLELGGEDSKKRVRSDKLIQEIYKTKTPNFQDIIIILSGKAGFEFNPKTTEAFDMKKYIRNYTHIPDTSFILEEESMDTLGNIYFSSKIILNLINQIDIKKYNNIELNIISQDFHIKRVKHFFLEIFHRWIFKLPIKYNFIKAKSKYSLFQKIIRPEIEIIIQKAIDIDFKIHKINTFQDFEDYLFSLPVYNKHYKTNRPIIGKSAYVTLLNKKINQNIKLKN
jgi:hypothetical protein